MPLVVAQIGAGIVAADIISLNFSENSGNQTFAGGELIGPLGTDSANWNSTDLPDAGDLANGSKAGLVDDTGAVTGVTVTWASDGVCFTGG